MKSMKDFFKEKNLKKDFIVAIAVCGKKESKPKDKDIIQLPEEILKEVRDMGSL